MNVADLFPEPRTDASRRLKELAARHNELRAEAGGLRAQAGADATERVELTAHLHAAQAAAHAYGGGGAEIKKAEQKLGKLETVAGRRAEASRIVADAVATVEGEVRRHAAEHAEELWRELREDNAAVAQRLASSIEAFARAHTEQVQAGNRAIELTRLVSPNRLRDQRIPELPAPVAEFGRHAAAAASSIPVPLPSSPGEHVQAISA